MVRSSETELSMDCQPHSLTGWFWWPHPVWSLDQRDPKISHHPLTGRMMSLLFHPALIRHPMVWER